MLSTLISKFGFAATEDIFSVALPLLGKLRDASIEFNEREDAPKIVTHHAQVWLNLLPNGTNLDNDEEFGTALFIVDLEDESEAIINSVETNYIYDVERLIKKHQMEFLTGQVEK